ncbi:MAG: hypothetical protein VXW25_09870, partial [Pseudomonadota bacterium]|nr:hypothetical protein [Pseudomonadota bacterium]
MASAGCLVGDGEGEGDDGEGDGDGSSDDGDDDDDSDDDDSPFLRAGADHDTTFLTDNLRKRWSVVASMRSYAPAPAPAPAPA